ncbi:hypothetical protein [Paenibacillus graminis]|uniref:hypothetical protein n=1 Tax=Paenibacillus graminis TaxID=189425 RepID=UPI00055D113E|nr:hypothetical protein [Paenibacillus graminis]
MSERLLLFRKTCDPPELEATRTARPTVRVRPRCLTRHMVDYGVIRPYSNTTAVWEDKVNEALGQAFSGKIPVKEAALNAAKVMNESLSQEK